MLLAGTVVSSIYWSMLLFTTTKGLWGVRTGFCFRCIQPFKCLCIDLCDCGGLLGFLELPLIVNFVSNCFHLRLKARAASCQEQRQGQGWKSYRSVCHHHACMLPHLLMYCWCWCECAWTSGAVWTPDPRCYHPHHPLLSSWVGHCHCQRLQKHWGG